MKLYVFVLTSRVWYCYTPLLYRNIYTIRSGFQVTSLPDLLFQLNSGVHNVVEGSVIQLYCSVESTTATLSWTKNGSPVVLDVPHLHERTKNDTQTSSVLTVDAFQFSDSGTYQCHAEDGSSTESGTTVTLTGKTSYVML